MPGTNPPPTTSTLSQVVRGAGGRGWDGDAADAGARPTAITPTAAAKTVQIRPMRAELIVHSRVSSQYGRRIESPRSEQLVWRGTSGRSQSSEQVATGTPSASTRQASRRPETPVSGTFTVAYP